MIYPKQQAYGNDGFFWTMAKLNTGSVVEVHGHTFGKSKLAFFQCGWANALSEDVRHFFDFNERPIIYTEVHGINGWSELVELPQGMEAARWYACQAVLALEKSHDEVDCMYALLMSEYHLDGAERHEIEQHTRREA